MARPWMPLYVADYLADTGHLSVAEHGAYMLLIMHYWQAAGLPNDEVRLARICRMDAAQWAESRDVLAALFDDGWKHGRIDEEIATAEDKISKRKSAGEAGAAARHGNRSGKRIATAMANAKHLPTQPHSQSPSDEVLSLPQSSEPREEDFSPKEISMFVEQYPKLDIPRQLRDLGIWCDKRGITIVNERRSAIVKTLKAKAEEAESKAAPSATGPPPQVYEISNGLLSSRGVRLGGARAQNRGSR